jgi:hypothetical protein
VTITTTISTARIFSDLLSQVAPSRGMIAEGRDTPNDTPAL